MQLVALYKQILESIGLQVEDNDYVSMDLGGEKTPCNVTIGEESKRLVLPTQAILKEGNWTARVAFHPLCENVNLQESPVLKKLRTLINLRLNAVASVVLMELMTIAVNTDYHSKLSATASKYLSHVPDVDEKTLTALTKVLQKISTDGPHRLVNVYLRRGGQWKGNDVSRLAAVNFPILDAFDDDQLEIFGVKMRKKDKVAIGNLFNYVFPKAAEAGHYSYGSNSMIAPYFHALVRAYAKVAKQLNDVLTRYRKHIEAADELIANLDWVEMTDDLSVYRDLIPRLNGNDGTRQDGEAPMLDAMPKVGTVGVGNVTAPGVVTPTAAPSPTASGNALTWDDVVRSRQQHSPQGQPGWQPPAWNQPQPAPPARSARDMPRPVNQWGQQMPYGQAQPINQWNQPQPVNQWGQPQQPGWGQGSTLYPSNI